MDLAAWRAIIDNDYVVPSTEDIRRLAFELVERLGSPDREWREVVAYPVLEQWIHRGYVRADDLHELVGRLLVSQRAGLGEQDTDTVFARSSACLILAEVLYEDGMRPFLQAADVVRVLEHTLAYYTAEADLRGYVADKGWAHAVAHGADLLWVLALNKQIEADDHARILDCLSAKIAPANATIFAWNEDQRLARAILGVLGRGTVEPEVFAAWLGALIVRDGTTMSVQSAFDGDPPGCLAGGWCPAMLNVRSVLGALVFHLSFDDAYATINPEYRRMLVETLLPLYAA